MRTSVAGKSFALSAQETSPSTVITDTIRRIDFEFARFTKLLGTLPATVDVVGLKLLESDLLLVLLRSLPEVVWNYCLRHSSGDTYESYRSAAKRWEEPQRLFGDFGSLLSTKRVSQVAQNRRGLSQPESYRNDAKVGMILFIEAHLEYNAGLVISIRSASGPSPIDPASIADTLASELADYRHQLLAMAKPPDNPTDAALSGSLFIPLIGVPMQNSLHLVITWALYGTYMCKTYWPCPAMPSTSNASTETGNIRWPKRAHPGALTKAGQERTPWLTSWARPPLNKDASPHYRTLKVRAKPCRFQVSTCSKLAAYYLTV